MSIRTETELISEIRKIMDELGHFPTFRELGIIKRYDLVFALRKRGGSVKIRQALGANRSRVPDGFWTDDILYKELNQIKNTIGHFPTRIDLENSRRYDIISALTKRGGINKFRALSGLEPLRKNWTYITIIEELTKIKTDLGHFPTATELIEMGREDLRGAINRHYGSVKDFRKRVEGCKKPESDPDSDSAPELTAERRVTKGRWTDGKIIIELNKVINELGHFPIAEELRIKLKRSDLLSAIASHGGINKFRKQLGYPQHIKGRSKVNRPAENSKNSTFRFVPQLHVQLNPQND